MMYNKYVKSQYENTISSPTDKNDSNYQKLVSDKKNSEQCGGFNFIAKK